MATPKKMRSVKQLPSIKEKIDDQRFDNFVDGADPMHAFENEKKPWDGLPATPKARLMLLVEPSDKARLDFISKSTGLSAQVILRRYIVDALRQEADGMFLEEKS